MTLVSSHVSSSLQATRQADRNNYVPLVHLLPIGGVFEEQEHGHGSSFGDPLGEELCL
jgi:hypothetical protein